MRRRTKIFAGSGALVLAAWGVALAVTAPAASAASTNFAPYVDLSLSDFSVPESAFATAGVRSYTAAFVIGNGCTPVWGDFQGINTSTANDKIARAESKGAKTIIAFGGAAGAELGQSCSDTAALTKAYQAVIDKYKVNSLDFDIEGAAIADPASIKRRFQAINALEAANRGLVVSLTIPVLQSGPDANGMKFLQAAADNGTRVDIVNAMTMDYGGAVADMSAAAISAAKGTLAAAKQAFPGFTFRNIGITPMIGQNDSAGEITTIADAKRIVDFANANGVGRVAFWSLGRDQACAGGAGGGASAVCSSLNQAPLDFTKTFSSFGG